MPDKVSFPKPSLSYEEQANLLLSRKLVCEDKTQLIASLKHYNYYRLSGYCLAFEKERHVFHPGVTFEDLADAYEFDRKMRKILMESLELIEIQLRTSLSYYLAQKYGPFSHESKDTFFISEEQFFAWQNTIHTTAENSKEIFIKSFKNKYTDFPKLPIWILVEILSFGSLSHLFSYLKNKDKKEISEESFNIHATILENWLHVFSHIRNLCAHHNRVFDRTLSIKPKRKNIFATEFPIDKIIFSILAIRFILRSSCFPQTFVREWTRRVEDLFANPPHVPNFYEKVGSPIGDAWLDSIYWK